MAKLVSSSREGTCGNGCCCCSGDDGGGAADELGSQGLEVSALGLGCMGMSAYYGPPKPEPDIVALIHHAVAAGVTLLDASDIYGPHTNELLLGKALQGGVRGKVQLATKFGILAGADGARAIRGDPAYVRSACEGSLRRLGVECIDLYYQHRVDVSVPIEVTNGGSTTLSMKETYTLGIHIWVNSRNWLKRGR
ncbi:hypothetical protein VPH35_084698 [Triticum aestivum]